MREVRPCPPVPDHEVLRKIGGGAYGEVWMARGVTGALRAVKVVWREDFEDDRGFEREFEGILRYEPLSRDHPGLVNILHVGRGAVGDSPYYYYVMELGDDVRSGREIDPVEYEPRTLRADGRNAPRTVWPVDDCLEVGQRLAEGLGHLHAHGLAHRDVKPSNVIFVNGKAKLADIGLVAARGQRTFVGTEGFVPPEGPGTARADVYGLGKVLYEIATGNDRMNFPELPPDVPSGPDRARWLALNRLICEVCDPRPSKRGISTAPDLAGALARIAAGKRPKPRAVVPWLAGAAMLAVAAVLGWKGISSRPPAAPPGPPPPVSGLYRISSSPEGADVIRPDGVVIGTTPTPVLSADVGAQLTYTLRKEGFASAKVEGRIDAKSADEPLLLAAVLNVFDPPRAGEAWTDHLGEPFQPIEDRHESFSYVRRSNWGRFLSGRKVPAAEFLSLSQNGAVMQVVLTDEDSADEYCAWFRENGIRAGFLTADHEVSPLRDESFRDPAMSEPALQKGWRPFRMQVRMVRYGRLSLVTKPAGAEVRTDGELRGITGTEPFSCKVRPGKVRLSLLLEGYKPEYLTLNVGEGATLERMVSLRRNESVVFGKAWENSLGMRLIPMGPGAMASVWETRVSDIAVFLRETKGKIPPAPFAQNPDHPAVNLSRDDALAFCKWLTARERKSERIGSGDTYRLPSDREWSQIAGLYEEPGLSPGALDARKPSVYPWGPQWDTVEKVGNFADISLARTPDFPMERTISGYNDGFAHTAPVGSFPSNAAGFFDLGGNVQEWVSDNYSGSGKDALGILRGGGWSTGQVDNLMTGSRNAQPPGYRDSFYGFRVVLAKDPMKED